MRPDEAVKRLKAWHSGKPLPAYATRHFAIAANDDLLIVAFVRMGGESAPWGIVWGHPGKKPKVLTVPEARNRDAVATMLAKFAPSLLDHYFSPFIYDWEGTTARDKTQQLRQVWMPNGSHVDMLHFLNYSYTFTKYGDQARYTALNALGRLAGWLFREHDRPGQMTVMAATDALRANYIFPAEDVRQAHLGYLLAWLETSGKREKRLEAAQEAEERSISTSLDPVIERVELEPLVEKWNDMRLGSRLRDAAKSRIDEILGRELRARFDLVERTVEHLRTRGPKENRGVAKLVDASLEEHWFQYLRMELRQNDSQDGIAFTPSPETDRNPAAAASRYFVQQASEEHQVASLIHDDEALQRESLLSGDGIRGTCVAVRNDSTSRAIRAVWTLDVPEVAALRVREGTTLCPVGSPKRELRVLSIERIRDDVLRIEVSIIAAIKEYRDEKGRVHPAANSTAFQGETMVLVPVSMDQIPRLKNRKIWASDAPGAWITHAQPSGAKTRLPKETAGDDGNLFEKLGKL